VILHKIVQKTCYKLLVTPERNRRGRNERRQAIAEDVFHRNLERMRASSRMSVNNTLGVVDDGIDKLVKKLTKLHGRNDPSWSGEAEVLCLSRHHICHQAHLV
jgi:hypothetical protein